MMLRMIVTGVTLMLLSSDFVSAQRAGSGGRGARHSGSHSGLGHRVGGPKHGPYPGRYSDSVEIYNFGFPIGPYRPRFRSHASYRVVPRDSVQAKLPQTLIPVNRYAADYQVHAEKLFRAGQFGDALRAVQHAIVEDPTNGKLFLFQGQILLAMGDYSTASNLLQYATDSLDSKDWGYVIENRTSFYKPSAFADQIKELKQAIRKSPGDGQAQFLLGYQYFYSGSPQDAGTHLSRAIELDAHRDLARRLLLMANDDADAAPSEPIPVPPEAARRR